VALRKELPTPALPGSGSWVGGAPASPSQPLSRTAGPVGSPNRWKARLLRAQRQAGEKPGGILICCCVKPEARIKPELRKRKGSAPAPGAVFRALAENTGAGNGADTSHTQSRTRCWTRGRVQPRPGRACSPTSEFGINRRTAPTLQPKLIHHQIRFRKFYKAKLAKPIWVALFFRCCAKTVTN